MRYKIKHITEYKYASRVSHCYNLAYMIPRSTNRQTRHKSQVSVVPSTSSTSKREDYFGNISYHFEIQRPHDHLIITVESEVETNIQKIQRVQAPQDHLLESKIEGDNSTLKLEKLSAPDFTNYIDCQQALREIGDSEEAELLLAKEYLLDSPMLKTSEALKQYAASCFGDNKPLLACVFELTQKIFKEFTYCPESTTIATPLTEVLKNKRGVCQDFAHLQIACLRAMGFPAKYVSGYIETLPAPGQEKLVGTDATHAWVSVFCPHAGWVEFDPTNNCLAGEQHIITSWGRDYFDVTPLRGVIYGGGEQPILNVSVDVRRIAP